MKALLLASVVAASAVLAGPAPVDAGQRSSYSSHSDRNEFTHDYAVLAVAIPNHLTKRDARRQVDKALAGLERDYGPFVIIEYERWRGDRLRLRAHILGLSAVGRIEVETPRDRARVVARQSFSARRYRAARHPQGGHADVGEEVSAAVDLNPPHTASAATRC